MASRPLQGFHDVECTTFRDSLETSGSEQTNIP